MARTRKRGEAKGGHIRQAKPGDHVANDPEVSLVELAFVEGIMGPGEDCRWAASTIQEPFSYIRDG
ncbi:MAG TPA: hypothetical protein VJM10_01520 [Candidatus Methylomirabilis sp.]|nr:hypothetical protein [Candidatus Methylomirabilis sp.]